MVSTQSSPVVSLQAPKDVSIEEIEAELQSLWTSVEEASASRAATFTLIVYEPDGTQQLLAALGFYTGPIDGIAGPRNEAAITAAQKAYDMEVTGHSSPELLPRLQTEYAKLKLVPSLGQDEGVKAQVSAYCPVNKKSKDTLICCEYITLSGTAEALERIGGVITELTISNLPTFLWWKATPGSSHPLFKRLTSYCDSTIIDSSSFNDPESDLDCDGKIIDQDITLADLNWRRLAPWQELSAEAFDPP